MKPSLDHLDKFRIPHPVTNELGTGLRAGCFRIPHPNDSRKPKLRDHFLVTASTGEQIEEPKEGEAPVPPTGWDHIAIHVRAWDKARKSLARAPSPSETAWLKDLFFEPQEPVLQFHLARNHPLHAQAFVVHLWRPTIGEITLPPPELV